MSNKCPEETDDRFISNSTRELIRITEGKLYQCADCGLLEHKFVTKYEPAVCQGRRNGNYDRWQAHKKEINDESSNTAPTY